MQENYTEGFLIDICKKLQLSETLYQSACDRYESISQTIQKDSVFHKVDLRMYPHGSFRLGTTVKPLKGNEYDLDFVIELPKDTIYNPKQLYDDIYRILSTNGTYCDMVEKKTRCIRVNYANDFHMDIMPAKVYDESTHEIIVPDRDLKLWYHHSNPIGYAEWFEKRAKDGILNFLNENRQIRAEIEPVTDQQIAERMLPIKRAVQLVKRYRDMYCERTGKEPVRSIVISTLIAEMEVFYATEIDIIEKFCFIVNELKDKYGGKPFIVNNPVVDEILTEKWEENTKYYSDFISMVNELAKDVAMLKKMTTNIDVDRLLKKMFGEKVTNDILEERAKSFNEQRKNGKLTVNGLGTIGVSAADRVIKRNTFYGK